MRHFADGDIPHHADFVVHVHDGNQNGVVTHRCFELVGDDDAVALRRRRSLQTLSRSLTAGVQHRFVLGLAGDDVLAFFDKSWQRFGSPCYRTRRP